jgi:16S rRNA (uracil1498-N3)-methyltransferase
MRDDQYFYALPSDVLATENKLWLREEEARHCLKVLRKKIGDEFFVIDGLGNEYAGVIAQVQKENVECRILETKLRPRELTVTLDLAQALIKKDRFDLIVEKATELGVHGITPVRTERSVLEPGTAKRIRWQKILISAMKQSRRSVLPALQEITSFQDLVENSRSYDAKIIFHERSERPVLAYANALDPSVRRMLLVIGPEGGFTETEVALSAEYGFISLSLGSRRLRAETAALAALSIFSNRYSL